MLYSCFSFSLYLWPHEEILFEQLIEKEKVQASDIWLSILYGKETGLR